MSRGLWRRRPRGLIRFFPFAAVIGGGADTTAPTLSSPTDTKTGQTTADLSVSTNEANGTLYWVVTTSATPPSKAQVKAGQNDGGTAAAASGNQAVSATGAQAASATGLTASTAYFTYFMHEDASGNQSSVSAADGFTTDAAAYTANAVTFDGTNDFLTRGSDFSPAATDGKNVLISFWFKRNGGSGTALRVISSNAERFLVRFTTGNFILFVTTTAGGTTVGTVQSTVAYTDTSWHHCLIQLDAVNAVCRMYVDDVDVSGTVSTSNNNSDFTLLDWSIGAVPAGTTKFIGDMSDVYMNLAATLDISNSANRRKFISAGLKPVDLGSDGSTPTGSAPIVYLSGTTASWHTNDGTGGGFTLNGTLDQAATSPSS